MRIAAVLRVRDEEDILPWTLSNLTFADHIHVSDGGSVDSTRDILASWKDPRLTWNTWEGQHDHYERQYDHLNFAINSVPDRFDWYWVGDADELPCAELQSEIVDIFSTSNPDKNTAVELPFLYVCPGWTEFYPVVSRWPAIRCFDHRPSYEPDESKKELALSGIESLRRVGAYSPPILHFNWALSRRWELKKARYEQHFGRAFQDPDQEYPERRSLPDISWYDLDGRLITPIEMAAIFDPGVDE